MEMEIKNGTVFDGIIKIDFFYRWRPIVDVTTITTNNNVITCIQELSEHWGHGHHCVPFGTISTSKITL
jgi:hypothetical protein